MAMAEAMPFMVGAGGVLDRWVSGKVSRAARGMDTADAADACRRPGRAFGWPFTAAR
jgi:hypothetical protein